MVVASFGVCAALGEGAGGEGVQLCCWSPERSFIAASHPGQGVELEGGGKLALLSIVLRILVFRESP